MQVQGVGAFLPVPQFGPWGGGGVFDSGMLLHTADVGGRAASGAEPLPPWGCCWGKSKADSSACY